MRRWTAIVDETVARRVRYEVEADTYDQANDLFLSGETVEEVVLSEEVIGRTPHEIKEIAKHGHPTG